MAVPNLRRPTIEAWMLPSGLSWMTGNCHVRFLEGCALIVPRSYVQDEGRPLDDALQGQSSNRPRRREHNDFGRERWRKRHP